MNREECENVFELTEDKIDFLSNAIVMLNSFNYNPNVKPIERPTLQGFLSMLKPMDLNLEKNREYYQKIYERIKLKEFKSDPDHVNVVIDLEKKFVYPKRPSTPLALPFRRLICSVKLFEVYDLSKKEKLNTHERDVFLFNDMIVVSSVFFIINYTITFTNLATRSIHFR